MTLMALRGVSQVARLLLSYVNCSPSRLYTVLQHPVSDPVELGGDTTLQCSVLTDTSAGEHSVYWFRHGSGESHPGIIYTHGNRSDQCKSSSETDSSTQSCVYKLPKRNLSLSDAGTYYCAVLMCGEIIFGNGTKLDFVGNDEPITVSTSSVKPTYTLTLYGRMLLPFDQYMVGQA
ncbi:hypothetical protein NFI96_031371 [Prochilodus magdalenae]|nr:hypothetical protein NFI96_031371 [Prochilodus magdalenae]